MEIKSAEVGPIRPPSESQSLLIRISRNCPWNRCTFCPVYKGEKFSLRPLPSLLSEIDFLSRIKNKLLLCLESHSISYVARHLDNFFPNEELNDAHRLLHWLYHGTFNVFLQDADPLLRKKDELFELLKAIKTSFPEVRRITAYARATTIGRFTIDELKTLKSFGLSRIHTGLESGSKRVLDFVKKGENPEDFISAGEHLLAAGIEYSLYVMPGLGGKAMSKEHVRETIHVLNLAKPTFIRFRTLALYPTIPLYQTYKEGHLDLPSERDMVLEIKEMLDGLTIATHVLSDHNLNLLMEINGTLPQDKPKFEKIFKTFFSLSEEDQLKFIIARRLNLVFELGEYLNFTPTTQLNELYNQLKALPEKEREEWFLERRALNL